MTEGDTKMENLKVLDAKTIAKRLSFEYDEGLVAEHIVRPQADRICAFYRLFLMKEFEVTEESLFCIPFQAQLQAEEHEAEMFRNSYSTLLLYKTLSSVFNDVFGIEFTMSDLINPEPDRTRRLFSMIVHFAEVIRRVDEPARKVHEELEAEMEKFKEMEIQSRALEEKLVEERKNDEARKRRENQLAEDKHHLMTQVRELTRDAEACRSDITTILDAMEKHKAKMLEAETRSKELSQKEKYLLEGIIDNPAQMLAEKGELAKLRDELKESLHKSRTELAELKSECELHGKIISLMETGKGATEELKQTRMLFDQVNLELVALERELEHYMLDVDAATQDQTANETNRVAALNAHEKALIQHNEMLHELKTSIVKLNEELEKHKASGTSKNKENAKADIREKQQELNRLRNEIERRQSNFKSEWAEMFSQIDKMRRKVDKGSQRFSTLVNIHQNTSLAIQGALKEEGVEGHNGSFVHLASPVIDHCARTPAQSAKKSIPRLQNLSTADSPLNNTLILHEIPQSAKRLSGVSRSFQRVKKSETYDGEHSFTGPLGRF
ncbi:unnamed protein product, partial [Mesorhabditis belari]|uniref:Kinetochore protein Nuf2 N-terminal domain-containing protein n=1 Tax=Mesorhabditis belari TaxID=2138241 RepID=A0AAF3FM49_9BILA